MRTGPGQAPSARPGQKVTLPDELAAVPAEEDVPPRGVPRAPWPGPGQRRACQHPSAGVGVGGDEHGYRLYRGTARHSTL